MRIGSCVGGGDSRDRAARLILTLGFFAACAPATLAGEAPTPSFEGEIRPLLAAHCFRCHGEKGRKGGIDLSTFADEASIRKRRKLWRAVLRQVETREMPPAGEAEPTAEGRERLVGWLKQAVETYDRDDRDPGPSMIRRLSLAEYNATVRDLLGIDFVAAEAVGLPEDAGSGNSFGNLAAALSLPPTLLDKYFDAADKALDRLFGAELSSTLDDEIRKRARRSLKTILAPRPSEGLDGRDAARKVIARFATRAFRRPVEADEVERFVTLYDRAIDGGRSHEDALRLLLKATLVSPHFLLRIERDRAPKGSAEPYRVGDHELAARLSYFLWSTMPDEELTELADAGTLHEPATLRSQAARMLADPRAKALTENFGARWLQIKKLPEARPSQEFFPTFTADLRKAMYDETSTFFDKLREEDRSVLDLLDADYTYANQELAQHYGLKGVEGKELRRVALKPEDHRGGLLGMGSVLALTSHTSRTSPTMRGKWVLEVVFGTPPAPPPPEAGILKDEKDKKAATTFREQIARHAADATCAGCHRKMDPLGFALDNFDAVGSWREAVGGTPIDTTGELPGGESFRGVDELKQIIKNRRGEFVRNLVEQSFIYALGRELDFHNDLAVEEVARGVESEGHRFSALILGVVQSYPFQHRRNLDLGPVEAEPRPSSGK